MPLARLLFPTVAVSTAVAFAAPAGAQSGVDVSSGLQYREGDYGTGQRVRAFTIENQAQIQAGRLTVSASLPWERVDAPGNVVDGGGLLGLPIIVNPARPAARTRREGLGDLRIGASYAMPRLAGFELAISGQVKLPTASAARGLGTGQADFTVGAELSRPFGPVSPFVQVGYTMPGDPVGYDLGNSLSARGGVAAQLAGELRGSIAYGVAQSASPLVPDEEEISTALNVSLSRRVTLGLQAGAGLTSGSAGVSAGVHVGLRLF